MKHLLGLLGAGVLGVPATLQTTLMPDTSDVFTDLGGFARGAQSMAEAAAKASGAGVDFNAPIFYFATLVFGLRCVAPWLIKRQEEKNAAAQHARDEAARAAEHARELERMRTVRSSAP